VHDAGPLHMRVEVRHVDELGAAVVGGCGDLARERLVTERGGHQQDLPRLDVRAVDGELGKRSESGGIHRQAILPGAPNSNP